MNCFCDSFVTQVSQEDGHISPQLFGNSGQFIRNNFPEINQSDKNFKRRLKDSDLVKNIKHDHFDLPFVTGIR
jgi:hypothetical protein